MCNKVNILLACLKILKNMYTYGCHNCKPHCSASITAKYQTLGHLSYLAGIFLRSVDSSGERTSAQSLAIFVSLISNKTLLRTMEFN